MDGDASNALAALKSNPESPEAISALQKSAAALGQGGTVGKWQEAADLYEAALKLVRRGPGEQTLLVGLGTIYWKHLAKMDEAEAVYRRVRKADAVSPDALAFYKAYHTERDELPQLLQLLTQAQRVATDEDTRLALGIEMAMLAEKRPQSLERAIDLWKGLLRKQPGLPEGVEALRRLYTRAEKWNALVDLLKEELDRLPENATDAKVVLHLEMIPIYRDKMRLDVMVANHYSAILALVPDHQEALEALTDAYEKKSRYADLVAILTRRAEVTQDTAVQIDLYRKVAALWSDKLSKPQNAAAALEKILELDANDAEAEAALVDLYGRGRKWRALLDLYRKQIPGLAAARRRLRLVEMARLASERLSDHKLAIQIWTEVLDLNSADGEALSALAGLYERDKAWAPLGEILGQQARLQEDDPAAQAALLERRGVLLYEKLGAAQAARDDLQKVHELDPQNQKVFRLLREILGKLGDIDALETLYAARDGYEELCDVVTDLAEKASDPKVAIALRERVADIATGRLGQPERAIKAYERIVALDPGHRKAARALSELYRDTAKWSRLLENYELMLGSGAKASEAVEAEETDRGRARKKDDKQGDKKDDKARAGKLPVEDQLRLMTEARKLCEEKLGSKALAFKWALRAFDLAPDDAALFTEIERLGQEAEEWTPLFDIYDRVLQGNPEAALRGELLRKSLVIATTRTKRPAEARRLAEALLELVPGDDAAEAALQQILINEERWPEVVALMHRRQARMEAGPERADLLMTLARLEEEKLGKPESAIASLRQVVAFQPEHAKALAVLGRLFEARNDFAGLAEVLGRQAEMQEGESDRGALLLRLAHIQENELRNGRAARASYLAALEADPVSVDAVSGLERGLAATEVGAVEVAAIAERLARYYELTERYDRWAAVLDRLVQASESVDDKLRNLELLTDLYEGPAADRAAAYRSSLRIFEIDPRSATNRDRLIRLATEAGKLEDLVASMQRVLEKATGKTAGGGDAMLRAELLGHIADLEEKQPGHEAQAEKAYRQILEIDALHNGALTSLTRILRDGERWADLRDLLEKREERLGEPKDKIALLAQIAEIDETLLGDREHAVRVLHKQLELEPGSLAVYQSLERLLTALGRWNGLADLLAKEALVVPPSEAEAITLRRVEVLAEKMGDFEPALDVLEKILKERPEHEEAERAVERMLRKPKAKQRAAGILGPLYNKAENWEGLVEVLQIRRAALKGDRAVKALVKIAELQELKLGDEVAALETWQTVLDLEPSHPEAMKAVERLVSMLERPGDLVGLYKELADKKDPGDLRARAELLTRAARLCVSSLQNREEAAKIWQMVLDLDPSSQEIGRPAAEALEALYPQIGNYEKLVDILQTKLEWDDSAKQKAELLVRLSDLQERALKQPDEALAHLRMAFELLPDDPRLLDKLEPVFEARGEWRDLVEVLRRRMELAVGIKARRKLRWRIADLQENKLADLDEAIATVQAIMDEPGGEKSALDALDRLYDKKGAHGLRLEVIERRLVLTDAPADRVTLLKKAAAVLAGPLEQPSDALEKWREIILHAPDDVDAVGAVESLLDSEDQDLRRTAAETLEPLYEAASRWDRIGDILAIYVETDDDRRARMRNWTRLAEVRRDRLNDPAGALEAFGHAVRHALGEDTVMELLDTYEALGGALGRTDDVVALYEDIEGDVLREDVKLRLERRMAAEARKRGDLERAAARFQNILDQVTDDAEALAGLESIYRQRNDKEALYDLLARRSELVLDQPKLELPLRIEAGGLAVELSRSEDAIVAYERALELAPQNQDVVQALQALYETTERWVDLRELLERRLSQVARGTAPELIGIHERMARLEIEELGNRYQALSHLREILSREQDHGGAIAMAEGLLSDPETAVEAADLLEPVYARRSAWDKLIAIDEARREQTEDPATRTACTRRIARLYEEQVEDLDRAFAWYGKLFLEVPTERAVQEQLLRLAPRLDKWKELGALLEEYLYDEMSDRPEVLAIVRLAAEIFDDRLGDKDTARKFYRRTIDALASDAKEGPKAVAHFERALEKWEAWDELVELVDDQATRADAAAARVALMKRSARLSEERLGDPERAARTLREVLDQAPGDRDAAANLERILRAGERWSDLADHLAWLLDVEGDARLKEAAQLRLGQLHEEKLDNLEGALDHYGEILGRNPAQTEAREALERLLADHDLRFRAAPLLEPSYRHTESLDKLVAVLAIRAEDASDPAERSSFLQEMAQLEERLGHTEQALEARGRVWLEDVANTDNLAALESAVPPARAYARFVELLEKGAAEAMDPELQASLLGKAARVLEAQLANRKRAIETWRKALEARPETEEALVALERLLDAEGRHGELVAVLEAHIEASMDPEIRVALWKRVAELAEGTLKLPERAIEAWRTVLETEEGDLDALDALSRLYAAQKRWQDLADIFQRKIELAGDPDSARMLRFLAAKLHDEELKDPSEAATHLRAVLDATPGDAEALEALDKIFSREGQHPELLEILDLRAQVARTPEEADVLAFRAAQLLQGELSDVHGAVDRYRQILESSPGFRGARDALWNLARGEDDRAIAIAALEPVLRAQRSSAELVELLDLKAAGTDVPSERIPILAEMAQIEEEDRGDLVKAFGIWQRAFAEEPGDSQVRAALERIAQARGEQGRLAKLYEEKIDDIYDAGLQREMALRVAAIYEESLRNPDKALDSLRKALEYGGDETPVLIKMEALLAAKGRWPELSEVLMRRVDASVDPNEQAQMLASLGQVRLERLADRRGAFEAFRDALERVPAHTAALASLRSMSRFEELRADVLDVLEPLAESRGDHGELVELYEQRAQLEKEPEAAAGWWRREAELCETALSDLPRALAAYGRALAADPEGGLSMADDVTRVALASNRAADGARALETACAKAQGFAMTELAQKAASLFEQVGGANGEGAAEQLYRRVLGEDAENQVALAALEALYRKRGDRALLAKILEQRGHAELDPAQRVALFGEAAGYHQERGDVKAAVAAWEQARQGDEGNPRALDALAAIYAREGRHADLATVLEEKARATNDAGARATLFVRIGDLRAGELGDEDAAATAYREALDTDPSNPDALNKLAALEEARGDYSALEDVLLQRLAALDGQAQIPVLFRLVQNARERLRDDDRALGYLRQVQEVDPTNHQAGGEIEKLLAAASRWHDLIDLLEDRAKAAAQAKDREGERRLRLRVAEIWAEQLDSPESACETVEAIVKAEPNHLPSLITLGGLYERANRHEEAVAVLEKAAAAGPKGREAADLHFRMGRLLAARDAPPADVEQRYVAALEADASHEGALKALEDIARKSKNAGQLVSVLEMRERIVNTEAERKAMLREISELYRGPLDTPEAAMPALERLVALEPEDLDVREAYGQALVLTGRAAEGEKLLENLIDDLTRKRKMKQVARLHQTLGLAADRRGDRAKALANLRAAYKIDPSQPKTLAVLGRIAEQNGEHEDAMKCFRALLLQSFDERDTGFAKADVYFALGRLHLAANEVPKAKNMLERGLEVAPGRSDIKALLEQVRN